MDISGTQKPMSATEFRRGFANAFPLWIGVVPFGITYAIAARVAGLSFEQTLAMSLLVFAGTSQITAVGLFAAGAGSISIVLTTLLVNLRYIIINASIASRFRSLKPLYRAALAFCTCDESYAVTVRSITNQESGHYLLLGANLSMYLCWQVSTVAGLLLGGVIFDPEALGLSLVFPLSFTVLLLPYLRSRPACFAAAVAGVLALAFSVLLPGSWYLLIGIIGGCVAGALLEGKNWKHGSQ